MMEEDIAEMKAAIARQQTINAEQEKFLKEIDERAARASDAAAADAFSLHSPEDQAFLKKARAAAEIHDKKSCKAAGFRWMHSKNTQDLCFPRK
jgi:hypothetical protein